MLAGASVVLAVAAVDTVLRWTAPECPQSNDLWRPDAHVGWVHTRNKHTTYQPCTDLSREFRTDVRINALGLRDVDRSYGRPPGVRRILVLGDSFTEALQVEREESFAALLERRLGAQGERVEVINAGVSGYGTDNELLAYRQQYSHFEVDLVLLVMSSENDVYENSRALISVGDMPYPDKPYFEVDDHGALVLRNDPVPPRVPPPRSFREWLHDTVHASPLVRLVTHEPPAPRRDVRIIRGPLDGARSITEQFLVAQPAEWAQARVLTELLVRQLAAEVAQHGVRLAVVLIPDKRTIVPKTLGLALASAPLAGRAIDVERPYRDLRGVVEATGLPYVSLLEPLRAHLATTGDSGYFGWNTHWTASGHAVAADAIAKFLQDAALFPPTGAASTGAAPRTPGGA